MEEKKRAAPEGNAPAEGAGLQTLLRRVKYRRIMSYEEYFSGYTEAKILREDGKGKTIRRVYTDNYIRQDVEDRVWRVRKALVGLAYLAAIMCCVFAGAQNLGGSEAFYVVIPGLLAIVFFIFSFLPVVYYILGKRNMTKWDYRAGPARIKVYALCDGVCLLAAAVGVLVHAAGGYWGPSAWLSCLGYLAAGGSMAWVWLSEKQIGYIEVENHTPVSAEAFDIDSQL